MCCDTCFDIVLGGLFALWELADDSDSQRRMRVVATTLWGAWALTSLAIFNATGVLRWGSLVFALTKLGVVTGIVALVVARGRRQCRRRFLPLPLRRAATCQQ